MATRKDRLLIWVMRIRNVLAVYLGVWYIANAVADPTVFRVVVAVIWTALLIAMCWSGFAYLTGRRSVTPAFKKVDPATVPFDDVVHALETTDGRIKAVRRLREQHPGLNLKDAADLVDEVTARPDL